MPLYDYRCPRCGYIREVRHGRDEAPTIPCADCAITMRLKPSAPGVKYNTFGFYTTDKNLRPDQLVGMTKNAKEQRRQERLERAANR
jgi:putative FmdB family regulatory protein